MRKTPAWWGDRNLKAFSLLPLSAIYALGNALDRAFTTPARANLPVISVGNVTIGGAGKTPSTIALAKLLQQCEETPHIISRGYGGSQFAPHRVGEDDDYRRVGDEALLLARAAPAWVGRDRLAATTGAWENGASVAICDDALQHYRLHKDVSILVIDGAFGFGNRFLFPAGPLREPIARACARADALIIIGDDIHAIGKQAHKPVFAAHYKPSVDTAFLLAQRWLAFAGLARPEKFYATLHALGADIAETHDFPDHHPYLQREVEELVSRAQALGARLITTEKDAVKLPTHLMEHIAVLPIALQFTDTPAVREWLRGRLLKARGS